MSPLYSTLADYNFISLLQVLIIFFYMIFCLLQIWKLKLHKKKVTHVEFNSRCEWMFATASVDQTVKIWDLRNIKNKTNFLHLLPHEKPVNAGELMISLHRCLQSPLGSVCIVVTVLGFAQIPSCMLIKARKLLGMCGQRQGSG